MEKNNYVIALENKLKDLHNQIAAKKSEVQEIFVSIGQLQKQAEHILELLKVEGADLQGSVIRDVQQASIADEAHEFLAGLRDKTPFHYRDLAESVMSRGIPIPGKDPSANLLSHISRDSRFIRVGAGTYGLAEWGFTPVVTKRKSKSRRRNKK